MRATYIMVALLLVAAAAAADAFLACPRLEPPKRSASTTTTLQMSTAHSRGSDTTTTLQTSTAHSRGSRARSLAQFHAHLGARSFFPTSASQRREVLALLLALGLLRGNPQVASAQPVPGMRKPAPKKLAKSQWTGLAAEEDTEAQDEVSTQTSARPVDTAAEVTDRVFMDIKIQGVNTASENKRGSKIEDQAAAEGRIVIGLYGKDAPETTSLFRELFAGTLAAECQEMSLEAATQRELLQKKQPFKQCKAAEDKPVNLEDSQVWRILADERIDFGRLKGKFLLREAPEIQEANTLTHDRAGVVSAKKGGGAFEFAVTPGPNTKMDDKNVVFGQVLEGFDLVAKLNMTPVKKFVGNVGEKEDATATDGACYYGSKNAFCGANKPLQRITVVRAGLEN